MSLLKEYLATRARRTCSKNDIRFRVVGRMNELDASVQKELAQGLAATSSCRGMTFNIALELRRPHRDRGRLPLARAATSPPAG